MTLPARVLLTGATGFLGHHLHDVLRGRRVDVVVAARSGASPGLDLDDMSGLTELVRRVEPDLVIHSAAESRMSVCATDPEAAMRRNGHAVEALARGGATLVQISTDLVFDGEKAPYAVGDEVCPTNSYGLSKAAGEAAALSAGGAVLRLPLLFGASFDGQRGATDMIRGAIADGRELGLFEDEFRTPVHVRDAAERIVSLALAGKRGIHHLGGPERLSRFELGRRFCAMHGLAEPFTATVCEDPTRPRDVSLADTPDWSRSLDEMLRGA